MNHNLFQQHLESFVGQPVTVGYSAYEDFHYQSPVLLKVKIDRDALIAHLLALDCYEKVEITGKGFLSVKFKRLVEDFKTTPKRIVVDYCGVNVAKEMHIGHIRSMFIGDYVTRVSQYLGHDVTPVNHVGDWGNQFGYLIAYVMEQGLDNYTNKDLTEYYKAAYELYKTDEAFALRAAKVAGELQKNTNPAVLSVWQQMRDVSLSAAEANFELFDLQMNSAHTQGESFYADSCQALIEKLIDQGIATKTEDATLVAFFTDKSPLVLQKSNGNYLYALYDLAAIEYRVNTMMADKIIYVVDKRQALHFQQVFDIAKRLGYNVELEHLGFGTILGADKKPLKTKEGKSLYLADLFAEGVEILSAQSHYKDLEPQTKSMVLHDTIVGGMKYYDLKFSRQQDYVFDWANVLNFTGNSAPYLQNAYVRIDSIFHKVGDVAQEAEYSLSSVEQNILFECYKLKEMITFEGFQSQLLTEQTMKLCQMFHRYYEDNQIIGSAEESQRLFVIRRIQESLVVASDILGINLYPCKAKMTYVP